MLSLKQLCEPTDKAHVSWFHTESSLPKPSQVVFVVFVHYLGILGVQSASIPGPCWKRHCGGFNKWTTSTIWT